MDMLRREIEKVSRISRRELETDKEPIDGDQREMEREFDRALSDWHTGTHEAHGVDFLAQRDDFNEECKERADH